MSKPAEPVKSMTGFAAVTAEVTGGRIAIELKSVNHRYLEFQTRMAEDIRSLESAMREQLTATLTRGKVDCRVTVTSDQAESQSQPNATVLAALNETQNAILAAFTQHATASPQRELTRPLSVWEIMHVPGVLTAFDMTAASLKVPLLTLFANALTELDATRIREGTKLAAMIVERLDGIQKLTAQIAPLVPSMEAAYAEKLRQRIADANVAAASDDRLKQEVVLFASRIDIAEELNRLDAHVSEVRRVLKGGGAIGKRLDFLMQELNRESNTLGSKSVSVESTKVAIELKVLIEQMREQIQNIE